MIKAGTQEVSDIVITLPDGSAIQSSGLQLADTSLAITPPSPSIVYNENSDYTGFEIKILVSGVENTFKTGSQSGILLSNADLLNIRRLQPEAIVVESISGVTTDFNNAATEFKNFYPFNSEKFKLSRDIVASPISSLVFFTQQRGETDAALKLENALGINVNDLISVSGDDSLLTAENKQGSQDLDIVVTAIEKTINVTKEQVFDNIAKIIIDETVTRSGIQDFLNANIVDIAIEVKKEQLGTPTIDPTNEALMTNIGNNLINIIDDINAAQERGNNITATSVVNNILTSVDITQPTGTVVIALQENIEFNIAQVLGNTYIPPITVPNAPTDLSIEVINNI